MASGASVGQLTFGPFCLDILSSRLFREGVALELRPQAIQALRVLLQNPGRHVDYEQMIREAWEGISVSRHTVAVTVGEVKRALHEYGSWIICRPGLGYRLDAPKSDALLRKGWHFLSHRTRESLDRAAGCFQQAAREDNTDFRAFEGLSRSYLIMGTSGMRCPCASYTAFLEAHREAVALAGLTAELRSDRGYALHMFERRPEEAEIELLRARQEQPALASASVRLTMVYAAMGRLDDALRALEEANAADPLLPVLPAAEINVRFCRREFDAAIACGKKALELHPYVQLVRVFYALSLEYAGHVEEALAQYGHAGVICSDLPWLQALKGACLVRNGRRAEAAAICAALEEIRATEYVDAYYMALLRDALGERDEAFCELHRACEEGSTALPILNVDPKMDGLREDRRFRNIVELAHPRGVTSLTVPRP